MSPRYLLRRPRDDRGGRGALSRFQPGGRRRRERLGGTPAVVSVVLLPRASGDLRLYRRVRRLFRQPGGRGADTCPGRGRLTGGSAASRGRAAFPAEPLVAARRRGCLHV